MGEGLQLLTNSRRQCFNDCPRKHYYAYELCRRPVKTSTALWLGDLVHKALEVVWTAQLTPDECTMSLDAIFRTAYSAPDADKYEVVKAHAMVNAYRKCYPIPTRYDDGFGRVCDAESAEVSFVAPLINPSTGKPSRTWQLAGKMDAIASDGGGGYLLVEHKTTSDNIAPGSEYWQQLAINSQISGYKIGAEALNYNTYSCLYDVLKKPNLRPSKATPEESRKYTKDGKLYSGQRDADETPEEYYIRCYNAIMAKPEEYFARREVVRSDAQLCEYLVDMWYTALTIRQYQLQKVWPRNAGACKRYGSMCEYFPVCAGYGNIEDDAHYKTVEPNPELGEFVNA